MGFLESLILILLGLNLVQLWYWSRQTHRLIDKVMSRSYFEFEQAKALSQEKIKAEAPLVMDDKEENDILAELNGMIRQ